MSEINIDKTFWLIFHSILNKENVSDASKSRLEALVKMLLLSPSIKVTTT